MPLRRSGLLIGALTHGQTSGYLPAGWLERLELRETIETLATDLLTGNENTGSWRRRYPGN